MIFITGPLYSGKKSYAMKLLGCSREELSMHAVWDVQEIAAAWAGNSGKIYLKEATSAEKRSEEEPTDISQEGLKFMGRDPDESGLTGAKALSQKISALPGIPSETVGIIYKDTLGMDHYLSRGTIIHSLEELADRLSQYEVIISTETGGGVVPADRSRRMAVEAAGRLNCLLAERAETVIRVFCGLPQVLKGSISSH